MQVPAGPRPADLLRLQGLVGNQAVQRALARRAAPVHRVPSGAMGSPAIQLMKDYRSANVNSGSGLTPTKQGPHGKWHIHAIQDDDSLGRIVRVFIRFEGRPLNFQHLMFDEDGNIQDTNLRNTGSAALINWGTGRVAAFLSDCADLTDDEIEKRRQQKAEEEKKKAEYIANLDPQKEVGKYDYSSKQASLFGPTPIGKVSEEKSRTDLSMPASTNQSATSCSSK